MDFVTYQRKLELSDRVWNDGKMLCRETNLGTQIVRIGDELVFWEHQDGFIFLEAHSTQDMGIAVAIKLTPYTPYFLYDKKTRKIMDKKNRVVCFYSAEEGPTGFWEVKVLEDDDRTSKDRNLVLLKKDDLTLVVWKTKEGRRFKRFWHLDVIYNYFVIHQTKKTGISDKPRRFSKKTFIEVYGRV